MPIPNVWFLFIGFAIAVGSLVSATSASAMPMSCSQARALSTIYKAQGDVQFIFGDYDRASYYYGKAQAVVEAAC